METPMDVLENMEIPADSETNPETETAETVNAAKTVQPEETEESAENTETDQPTETEEIRETPIITQAPAPATAEITAVPVPTPEPKKETNGNWGTVALIILLIVAAGAALAVILLRGKNKSRKSPYQQKADYNATAPIDRETLSAPVSCGMAQTIGKRGQQQDSLYCSNWKDPSVLMTRGLMAAVADGIGGLEDGNLASMNAMQAIRATFLEGSPGDPPSDRLLACAAAAQKSVVKLTETSNCGSTLVSVLITGRTMHLLSIGDSRIYLYRAGASSRRPHHVDGRSYQCSGCGDRENCTSQYSSEISRKDLHYHHSPTDSALHVRPGIPGCRQTDHPAGPTGN